MGRQRRTAGKERHDGPRYRKAARACLPLPFRSAQPDFPYWYGQFSAFASCRKGV